MTFIGDWMNTLTDVHPYWHCVRTSKPLDICIADSFSLH